MKKDSLVYIIIYLHTELKLSHFTLRKGYQMNFSFTFTSLLSATGLIIEKCRTITFRSTKSKSKGLLIIIYLHLFVKCHTCKFINCEVENYHISCYKKKIITIHLHIQCNNQEKCWFLIFEKTGLLNCFLINFYTSSVASFKNTSLKKKQSFVNLKRLIKLNAMNEKEVYVVFRR